jgi:hypothetical protein
MRGNTMPRSRFYNHLQNAFDLPKMIQVVSCIIRCDICDRFNAAFGMDPRVLPLGCIQSGKQGEIQFSQHAKPYE